MKNLVALIRKTNRINDCLSNLSFSCVFLGNKNLAQLCLELGNEFKRTRDEIYKIIFSLHGVKKDELITITDIIEIESDLVDSFLDRAQLVLNNKPIHPVVKKVMDQEEKRSFVVKTSENSSLNGKSFLELRLKQKAGVKVMAIKRNDKWVVEIKPKQKIKQDDTLICFGDEKSMNLMRKVAAGKIII